MEIGCKPFGLSGLYDLSTLSQKENRRSDSARFFSPQNTA